MQINKFKLVRILSNGSIYFTYKTYDNLDRSQFSEKDNLNFIFNIKKDNNKLKEKDFSRFKDKYFIS